MEHKERKQIRLKEYDYSSSGVYFITVCVKDKKPLLWNNVGATSGRPNDTRLSAYGKIVDDAILKIPIHYPNIKIDNYVVMPNHIHLLLSIEGDIDGRPLVAPTISRVIQQMKGYVSKQIGHSIWQKLFIDHIIRNERDYIEHYTYIDENPVKWELDKLYIET
ncbi:MAG: transposase [Ruminococcus sp.]|nr:transposase [Ruminococcus sp.]